MSLLPEQAILNIIEREVDSLSVGNNLFRGPVRPPSKGKIPSEAVFALDTSGLEPQYCIGDKTGQALLFTFVQVRVRGCPNDYSGGRDLADKVLTSFHDYPKNPIEGLMNIQPRESSPIYLGQDDTEHHEWSMNLEVLVDTKIKGVG